MSLQHTLRGATRAVVRERLPLLLALAGGSATFLLMAHEGQVRHGSLVGALCMLVCVGGLLRALGMLREQEEPAIALSQTSFSALPDEPAWAAPRVTVVAAICTLLVISLAFGGAALPWAIVAALLLLVPSALRRPGLLVFVAASALYLPLLGSFGLWDPWETHYGEVSREILSRDDWISLWWAQDRWFWSKPIFIFWTEALVWSGSGVGFLPDSNFEHAEWVLRTPTYLVSMAGLLAVYFTTRRFFGKRAATLASLVLATMPYYAMLTHQAITDMPFVGTMTVAMMLLIAAVQEDPERRVHSYRIGPLVISAQEIVLGLFLLIAIPQLLYLASRNISFAGGLFVWHPDSFMSGSGHNPNVPGNPTLQDELPRVQGLFVEPLAQAIYWAIGCAFATFSLRRERRAQSLGMMAFYLMCGLSFMAKGLPGFALPGLIAFFYLLTCGRFSLLFEGRLRVALGALVLLTTSLSWFLAMYMRHGKAFTDRILIHDHLNRLTEGVHGDNGTIQYFIEQLGYGMFPWIALAPLALGSWFVLRPSDETETPSERAQRETLTLLGLWFATAFTLFSAMTTKFHHYIFPAVPAVAVLIGLVLDRMLGAPAADVRRERRVLLLALPAAVPLVLGVAGLRGNLRGILPDGLSSTESAAWVFQHGPDARLCVGLVLLGLCMLVAAVVLQRRERDPGATPPLAERGLTVGLLAGAALCAFVGRDLSWVTSKRPAGDERLIGLFIYNYDRPFPAHLDYRPVFGAFAIVACALIAASAVHVLRPVLARSFLGLCLAFTLFSLDVYMLDLTPHWSQRDLVKRYYAERKSAKEPLVAWQMNWKGENFYTGNRVAVFVDTNNKEVSTWMDGHKGQTAYFVLEHGRLGRFRSLAGTRTVEPRSTERDNNKFVLVKVAM
jgi:4-amino-4-deoxy-L-arabinose transferase-like glycosyltransferase